MSRRGTLSALVVAFVVSMTLVAPVSAAAMGAQAGDAAAIDAPDTGASPALDTSGHSIQISSDSGVDGAMNQTVDVEPNTTYTLSGWIKTENVQAGGGYGAQLNVHELGQDSLTESVTGTQEWTHVETTIDSADYEELQINALLGGWGNSDGTAYYDDIRFENPQGENLLENGDLEAGSQDPWRSQTWTGDGEFGISDQESVATGDVSTRTIESDTVQPGGDTLVTVDVETSEATNVTVVEHFDPAFENVEIVNADGADISAVRDADDAVFATYTDRSEASLTYRVTLGNSSSVQEGDRYSLSGFAHSDGDRSATGGQDHITVGSPDTMPETNATVQFTQEEYVFAPGETRTLTVETTAESVAGHETRIEFDPDVVKVESVEAGDIDSAIVVNRDNENGMVTAAQAQAGETDAPVLLHLTVTFEGDEGDSASLAFDREYTSLFDADTDEIDVAWRDATIQSGTPGDVNLDGEVDTRDAILIQQYLAGQDPGGENTVFRPAMADITDDGSVTITDVLAVLKEAVGNGAGQSGASATDASGEESFAAPAAPA